MGEATYLTLELSIHESSATLSSLAMVIGKELTVWSMV
jgi:hypothetical protein